jgi:hypothetical protein
MSCETKTAVAGALGLLVAMVTGCGGVDSDSSNGGGMSQAEAQAFSEQLSRAAAGAMLNGQSTSSQALARRNGLTSVQCTPDYSSCTYDIDVSYRVNCTAGGAINLTGNLTGSMNSSGTGLLQIQVTETIADWQCISDYVINGDPYISLAGQFSYVNGQPSTSQTLTISGGFKWGTSAAESCQIHLTANFGSSNSGTVSGTVCGRSVSTTF